MSTTSNFDFEERFSALSRVYGEAALQQLRQSHLCVVGIGGVGSWVAESLARSAVGQLTLIDGDQLSRSNINRQLHALESTLGRPKVEVMQQRIAEINPDCRCHAVSENLGEERMAALLTEGYQGVVDAIDQIGVKARMIYYCRRNRIPVVTVGGGGGLLDPTRIEIRDLSRTFNDPLAAKVRSELRRNYHFSRNPKRTFGVPCVFSSEQPRYPTNDGATTFCKPGTAGVSLDCASGYGSSVMVTTAMAQAAAFKVIEILLR